MNEEERKKAKTQKIQFEGSKKTIDLTGFIFVFDFIKHGSLLALNNDYLESKGSNRKIINPITRSKIIYGIASIMNCMHKHIIMHRNLDIDNVLIDENFEPKLCGFKFAKEFENRLNMTMAIGSPLYMAPETFLDVDEECTFSVDVFAYGMILDRMFTTKLEFANVKVLRSVQHFMMKIGRGIRPIKPENMPDSYWELINRCWDQDESKRPTFSEIVEELKSDKYAIEEFGMKTNVDELHEDQRKVDLNEYECERTQQNSDEKQIQIEEFESIILPPNYDISFEKCVFDEEDEKFHQVLSRIGEGATSIAYKIFDQRTGQVMCKKVLKMVNNDRIQLKNLKFFRISAIRAFAERLASTHPNLLRTRMSTRMKLRMLQQLLCFSSSKITA